MISFYNPPFDSSNSVSPIDKWKKFFNRVENLATSRNVIAFGDANLPKVNWDILDFINDYEADVLNLLNDTRMDQIVNFKTSISTLDLVFVNFPVINIEGDYKFDDSYSINGKHASKHYSRSSETPRNYEGRVYIPSVHFSFCRANFDSMNDHILLQPFIGYCWTNPDILLEQWYQWLNAILTEYVPIRTLHRQNLPYWVSSSTSHFINKC